ncbi:MAG: cupin domain-containing protein [Endomicrobiia bacterium]|nr:cupin domain-containing protein [Endomicrobiaceae bacterium]MDD3922875.1 cupin domain-containing protein [Endomicrobiaceae bacterium]
MLENIKQIAQRIKELREISDMSVESMSKELKIDVDKYIEYESGDIDIPVSFLYEIAGKFNVELTVLLTGEEPKLQRFSVVKKDKGLSITRRKEYKYQDLAFNFMHKKSEIFLVTVDPENKEKTITKYAHVGQEFNYILEGQMKLFFKDQEIILNSGDSIYFDSGYEHAMIALGNTQLKFLAVIF